jgi:hypothetical protein
MISMGVAVEQMAVKPTKSLKSIVTLSWLCASIDSPGRRIQSDTNRSTIPKHQKTSNTHKKKYQLGQGDVCHPARLQMISMALVENRE